MVLDALRLIEAYPDSARQRVRETREPRVLVVVGGASFSCGVASQAKRFCRCRCAMFDDSSYGLRDHPGDGRGYYLLLAGVRLVNHFSVRIVDPFDQVRLMTTTIGGKGRIGGCNIF